MHRLLRRHCRIRGLSKTEWSIEIGIKRVGFDRNVLEKGAQNHFQNDAIAVDQRLDINSLEAKGH